MSLGPKPRGIGGNADEGAEAQSPKAGASFVDAAGLNGIDPGIAAGTSYLLVCDNSHGIAVYDKTGKLLPPKPGQSTFENPFSITSLFAKVKANITPHLNLPSGLPPDFPSEITGYGDTRIMFDAYRKRFWIYARANVSVETDAQTIVDFPNVKVARRQKACVAVSKTEDPRDGFYTYWWNESIHNGECNNFNGCSDPVFKTSGEGADYPSLGISPRFFLATVGVNRRDPAFKTDTIEKAQQWIDCKTNFESNGKTINLCGPFYVHLMVLDADGLAYGKKREPREPLNRSYALFIDTNNYVTDSTENGDFASGMARGVKPVVMHGPQVKVRRPTFVNDAEAYFVTTFIDRSGNEPTHSVVLWSLVGDHLIQTLYPIRPFTFDKQNAFDFILNASYRQGKLYATFHECVKWNAVGGNCLWSIRALRINTLDSKVEIDRTFGVRNKFDDTPTARIDYQWPGIEVNKYGDIVLVYVRNSTEYTTLPQQVRFNVWYRDEPDIRPSRLLRVGEDGENFGTDTAGIAVDAADDTSIWVAHCFATNGGNRRIAVGRILSDRASPQTQPIHEKKP